MMETWPSRRPRGGRKTEHEFLASGTLRTCALSDALCDVILKGLRLTEGKSGVGAKVRLEITAGALKGKAFVFEEHDTFLLGRAPEVPH